MDERFIVQYIHKMFFEKWVCIEWVAVKRGVFEAVWRISHPNEEQSSRKWYKECELEEEAKKFEFVQDFAESNPKAYRAVRRRGDLIYELYPQCLVDGQKKKRLL